MRLADLLARKKGVPNLAMRASVRSAWEKNRNETDEGQIMEQRNAAVRGLHAYLMHETQSSGAFSPDDVDTDTR